MARTLGSKDISPKTRAAVVVYLTTQSKEGRLRYGTIERANKLFQLGRAAIEVIWGLRDDPAALVQPRRPYLPRKTRLSAKEVGERVAAVPLCQRQTLRSLETASGIPRSTLHRYLKTKLLRRFISRVALTSDHRSKWGQPHVTVNICSNS
ncbi:hypothetical protein PI124_g21597 [Phytophthora idaei]|nr:hypothetical protein PI125_g26050 [Phytophthora idaei]KAG3140896.1 hypothetical protein PI126_g15759 [Phytophthora idaei]KAG3233327.1 hypothetical protein PI124_g21597 [Phytophthora idaei]